MLRPVYLVERPPGGAGDRLRRLSGRAQSSATGDPAHLAEAHGKLMFLRDHAGEEYQTSILENVPLHRDIVAAWKEHGGE